MEDNPKVNLIKVADTLNSLAIAQKKQKKYKESEQNYNEAIYFYTRLYDEGSNSYLSRIAKVKYNLAYLKKEMCDRDSFILLLQESLSLYSQLGDKYKNMTNKIQTIIKEAQ